MSQEYVFLDVLGFPLLLEEIELLGLGELVATVTGSALTVILLNALLVICHDWLKRLMPLPKIRFLGIAGLHSWHQVPVLSLSLPFYLCFERLPQILFFFFGNTRSLEGRRS